MLGTAAVSLAIVFVIIDASKLSLHVPIALRGDATLTMAIVKALVTHPWLGTVEDIGAPYGATLYDFSTTYGDLTQLTVIKAMSLVMQDPPRSSTCSSCSRSRS